jgi:hypothetical protein
MLFEALNPVLIRLFPIMLQFTKSDLPWLYSQLPAQYISALLGTTVELLRVVPGENLRAYQPHYDGKNYKSKCLFQTNSNFKDSMSAILCVGNFLHADVEVCHLDLTIRTTPRDVYFLLAADLLHCLHPPAGDNYERYAFIIFTHGKVESLTSHNHRYNVIF